MKQLRATKLLLLPALLAFGATLTACQKAPELRGRIAGVKDSYERAERDGARRCAPRELALAHAYSEFAELELDKGSLNRAEAMVERAELNAKAAALQSPPEFCSGAPRPTKPVAAPGDADGDGYLDPDDRCPKDPENFNGFEDEDGCPDDPDTDGDGRADSVDACPLEPEDADGYLDEDGCPEPDNDLDTILDATDQCPLEAEDPDGYEDHDGCPEPDNDRDEVLDGVDECPLTPGEKTGSPLGCPRKPALVVVTDCEVKITQQIHFQTAKAVIQKDSFPILDAVVDVLTKNSSIRLEIQGHTDDKGSDAYNKKLSHQRAEAVRKYLVSHGVEPGRLEFHGYGEERPLVANDSDANRSLNRRVQFMRTEGQKEGCGPTPADTTP